MKHRSSLFWTLVAVAALGVSLLVPAISSGDSPGDEWKAPASADDKKNPVPSDDKSIAAGKGVYVANCLACHGTTGKGDGPAAAALGPDHKPGDLPSRKTQQQSDGALFWKISEGRKPMPTYSKLISETQRWQVIDYIRTFKSSGN
jgi:mono/diheme cytochrome c family protein